MVARRWNAEGKLFGRLLPEGIELDVIGLVDSWVAEAEDWLTAFDGVDVITPQEAFEAIECFGKLTRCGFELVQQCEGNEVLRTLSDLLLGAASERFAAQAIEFPDLDAWLSQANSAWDTESEDQDLVEILVTDLDASDFLCWFIESYTLTVVASEAYAAFTRSLELCHQFLDRRAVMFVIGEPFIRAVGCTIPEDGLTADDSGMLLLSTAKYIRLLDEIERVWDESTAIPSLDFLMNQQPFGRHAADWTGIPVLASTAGATEKTDAAQSPITWLDPSGKFEAITFLPNYLEPGGNTEIEVIFGTGEHFADAATELVGVNIRLGAAIGAIEQRQQGGGQLTVAKLCFESVASDTNNNIDLIVNSVKWS